MKRLVLIGLLIAAGHVSLAQKFWLLTYSFPGNEKNSIALIDDNTLVVGLEKAVIATYDAGVTWDTVLNTESITTLYYSKSGRLFVGGKSKVIYSNDLKNWDSVSINTETLILQFEEVDDMVFFNTGGQFGLDGYKGDGVFKSINNGASWSSINSGLGNMLSTQFIKADKYGRLLVGVVDNEVSNNTGLYMLPKGGTTWQKISLIVDGKNNINTQEARVSYFTGINNVGTDSVLISFDGVVGSVGVTMNLTKHVDDLLNTSYWNQKFVHKINLWWADRLMNGVHIAKNNDWYSSISGSVNYGGSLFSTNQGGNWYKHTQGVGTDNAGRMNYQRFVEDSKGKVYMIQHNDFRIYWADTSLHTGINEPEKSIQLNLFPNPTGTGESAFIQFENNKTRIIRVYNMLSELVYEENTIETKVELKTPPTGMYIIHVFENNKSKTIKWMVE